MGNCLAKDDQGALRHLDYLKSAIRHCCLIGYHWVAVSDDSALKNVVLKVPFCADVANAAINAIAADFRAYRFFGVSSQRRH